MGLHELALYATPHMRRFGQTKKDRAVTEAACAQFGITAEHLTNFSKKLLACAELDAITKGDAAFRNDVHYRLTYRSDKQGTGILPNERHLEYVDHAAMWRRKRESLVAEAALKLPSLIRVDGNRFNSAFNENEYPTDPEAFKSAFVFEVKIEPIPSAASWILTRLSSLEVERYAKQVEAENEARLLATQRELLDRLYEPVRAMADMLRGDSIKYHGTLVGNVVEVVNSIEIMNIAKNPDITAMADEIRKLVDGVDGQELKKPEMRPQRDAIAMEADALAKRMESMAGLFA